MRWPRQRVFVLIGLPGCGKSSWLAVRGANGLSSDEMRRLLRDNPADQTIHRVVFRLLRELLTLRIRLGATLTYIDATNLTTQERRPWIKIADWFGCDCEAVYFDIPLDECKRRNAARARVVPATAMDRLASRLMPPSFSEGFAAIVRVTTDGERRTIAPPEEGAAAR